MAQTQLPGTQIKDSSIKNVDVAPDAAIDLTKLALASSLAAKATPADADVFLGADSAASNVWKKYTWANIKATLKTYFDSIYATGAIPVKATGAEIITGTDDAKFATAKSIVDSNIVTTNKIAGANSVPTMTSNTAPSGVASASSIYSASFDAYMAFNHTYSLSTDVWTNDGTGSPFPTNPAWLQYKFPTPKIVTKYIIYPRVSNNNQSPTAWTLQGSMDGTNFTTLDTQSGKTFSNDVPQTFHVFNVSPYLFYRLSMTAGGNAGYVSISELELWGVDSSIKIPPIAAIKTDDNSVSNTTTYADDANLSINIPMTGIYIIEIFLNILANSTSSIKCQLVAPASTNHQSMRSFFTTTSSTAFGSNSTAAAEITNNEVKCDGMFEIKGKINFTNTGTLKLQWAQATAEVFSTYLRAGSFMKLTKV